VPRLFFQGQRRWHGASPDVGAASLPGRLGVTGENI